MEDALSTLSVPFRSRLQAPNAEIAINLRSSVSIRVPTHWSYLAGLETIASQLVGITGIACYGNCVVGIASSADG